MICKRCGKRGRIRDGLCPTCTTILDLEKVGYSPAEIRELLNLMKLSASQLTEKRSTPA